MTARPATERDALIAYAFQAADRAWHALHPPAEATGREKAILFIVGFTEATADTAALLLDRYPGATPAVLDDDARREAICRAIMQMLAPSFTEH